MQTCLIRRLSVFVSMMKTIAEPAMQQQQQQTLSAGYIRGLNSAIYCATMHTQLENWTDATASNYV
jgi:hypothetical protein